MTSKSKSKPAEVGIATPSKLASLEALLRRDGGATLEDLTAATGWQARSVRGAISGALKKKKNLVIASEKTDAGRIYRIVEGAGA